MKGTTHKSNQITELSALGTFILNGLRKERTKPLTAKQKRLSLFQRSMVLNAVASLKDGRHTMVVSPTGSEKSLMILVTILLFGKMITSLTHT